jgi:chromosome partitioning protein
MAAAFLAAAILVFCLYFRQFEPLASTKPIDFTVVKAEQSGMAKRAKIIAVYSLKGGVGKTSLAVNLAAESATQSGHRTLLWDLDSQAAASYILGHDDDAKSPNDFAAHSIFTREVDAESLTVGTPIDRLHLLPADKSLRHIDRSLFAKLTELLAKKYERIILDCPPGLTELSEQIMRAADLILVPVIPSMLSRRALSDVVRHIRAQNGHKAALLPIFSMVDRRRALHQTALAAEPEWPCLPMASAVEQMAERRLPISKFAPKSVAATAIAALWRGIDKKRGAERRV